MGIFFISIQDLYIDDEIVFAFPSPMGIFFISIEKFILRKKELKMSFRPLWGSFLFL